MATPERLSGDHAHFHRRRFLGVLCGAGVTGAVASLARAESPGKSLPWRVGAAVAEIPTPLDVGLLMSSGRQLWERFEGTRLPICARTMIVEKGDERIALVALDLLGLAGEAVGGMERFKQQVATAAGSIVRPDALILSSTHTHTSPESAALTDLYQTPAFKKWSEGLAASIGRSLRAAADVLRPCRLATGSHLTSGLALNRRIRTTKGIRSVRQPIPSEDVIGPEGPTDDVVRVAAFLDREDKPVAILVNFTAHPVLEMCIRQLSPDYPGELCQELERRHPGAVPLFFQGADGNINPPNVGSGAEDACQYGRRLADAVDAALNNLTPAEGNRLEVRWRSIDLPRRDEPDQQEGRLVTTRIAAVNVGGAAMVFLPGEPFVEIALAIREASPFPFTAVVGYSENYIGYIPTDFAFENGGYETTPGRWSRLAPGSEAIVRNEAIGLLTALHR